MDTAREVAAIDQQAAQAFDLLRPAFEEIGPADFAARAAEAGEQERLRSLIGVLWRRFQAVERDRAELRRTLDYAEHPYRPVEREPLLHSQITDGLDDGHPLAFECVDCAACGEMVHASNNECMQTWVEAGRGNYCLTCFVAADDQGLDEGWALLT